ncbi:hypothetical protein MK079_05685, partial [Candidatus Gracilibacteria bacterium]|nr:hypothetical protein [Candidatus Gracilibacteria bacterium]
MNIAFDPTKIGNTEYQGELIRGIRHKGLVDFQGTKGNVGLTLLDVQNIGNFSHDEIIELL